MAGELISDLLTINFVFIKLWKVSLETDYAFISFQKYDNLKSCIQNIYTTPRGRTVANSIIIISTFLPICPCIYQSISKYNSIMIFTFLVR